MTIEELKKINLLPEVITDLSYEQRLVLEIATLEHLLRDKKSQLHIYNGSQSMQNSTGR